MEVIHPQYLYEKELQAIGISEELLYKAATIVCCAMGEKWLLATQTKLSKTMGIARAFNKHPIYSLLTDPMVEKSVVLVLLATVLSDFSSSINQYLPRLRSAPNSIQAMYELFVAKLFVSGRFTLIGLEVEYVKGKPMDVTVLKGGSRFYIECNSTEQQLFQPSEAEEVMTRVQSAFKKLPLHSAVYFKQKVYYQSQKKVKQVSGDVAYKLGHSDLPLQYENDDYALSVFPLPDGHPLTVREFYAMVDYMMALSQAHSRDGKSQKDSLEAKEYLRVIGGKSPKGLRHETQRGVSRELATKISKKIDQHKQLLQDGKELVIVLDSEDLLKDDLQGAVKYIEERKYDVRYPTLSIMVASYSSHNWVLSSSPSLFITQPIRLSTVFAKEFPSLITGKMKIIGS